MIDIFYFDKVLKKAKPADLSKLNDKLVWVDITGITKEEAELVKANFGLHPLTIEDFINQHIRIKVEKFSDYLFCVFYGIKKTKSVELIELDFVIGKNFVISNHKNEIGSFSKLKNDSQKIESLFKKGPDFIFHKLLDMEVDNYFPVLEEIGDKIEVLEEKVAKKPLPSSLVEILKLKRMVVKIKKSAFAQREKVSFLAKNDYELISKKAVPYFRDVYDHAVRVSDYIDNSREAVGNAFDVYMSSIANNSNEVMKILSVIATIALPLTVVSGIYGTNFEILPGAAFPYGFWVMIFFMIILSVSMLWFFKKRNWF
ncbi:MAG: magnesium/cobalt transporter CorA [Candidatus Diapherotrites archaeon]